ncbi:50S ribosomal protein L23 [Peloplasma aerotolerans]|jgi:large subunit ribosomal protein L23|uniref:Large ribosomal subunit protein uL23 n=1 Tax=Peloplasma aerotolerans TaxID=3044389 RepID=A0AAW6U6D1_9MOLU|nr:50S ribosomal protein L23 [Mariniplasma sp. M4Ah]MDI6453452.1 50S ribosomal protein L23 [Mariniplasma sp. M4Ah]
MTKYYDIIKAPIITERTTQLIESQNKYTFKVDRKANKVEIKKAVEIIFNVNVLSVNTINVLPKFKRMGKYEGYKNAYKKAVVKLAEGQKIDAFTV